MMLKRIGRYFRGVARCVQHFHWSSEDEDQLGFADSDWAGSKGDAKSTSGGALLWGGHLLKSWSTGQLTIALSSGEAELYALTKVAAQCWDLFPWQILARLPAPRRFHSSAGHGVVRLGPNATCSCAVPFDPTESTRQRIGC